MEVCVDNIERLYKNYEILSGAADNILEVSIGCFGIKDKT